MNRKDMLDLFTDSFGAWHVIIDERAEQWDYHRNTVTGMIYCGGIYAGNFKRQVTDDEVHHDGLYLQDPFKGRGFAKEWQERCIARYRQAGILQITLSAVTDGRFVWRSLGFRAKDVVSSYRREELVKQVQTLLDVENWEGTGVAANDRRRFTRFAKKLETRAFTVHDLYDFALSDGRTIMELLQTHNKRFSHGAILSWHGVYDLVASSSRAKRLAAFFSQE